MTNNETTSLCAICGEDTVETIVMTQQFVFAENGKDVLITADIPVENCLSCGEMLVGEAGETARHEAVCNYLGRLSPKEIKKIRENMGLSQTSFAKKANIGVASLKRWETGANIQNASMDGILRELADGSYKNKNTAAFTPVFRTKISEQMIAQAAAFRLRPSEQFQCM